MTRRRVTKTWILNSLTSSTQMMWEPSIIPWKTRQMMMSKETSARLLRVSPGNLERMRRKTHRPLRPIPLLIKFFLLWIRRIRWVQLSNQSLTALETKLRASVQWSRSRAANPAMMRKKKNLLLAHKEEWGSGSVAWLHKVNPTFKVPIRVINLGCRASSR